MDGMDRGRKEMCCMIFSVRDELVNGSVWMCLSLFCLKRTFLLLLLLKYYSEKQVDSISDLKKLFRRGIDGVITNDPELAKRIALDMRSNTLSD